MWRNSHSSSLASCTHTMQAERLEVRFVYILTFVFPTKYSGEKMYKNIIGVSIWKENVLKGEKFLINFSHIYTNDHNKCYFLTDRLQLQICLAFDEMDLSAIAAYKNRCLSWYNLWHLYKGIYLKCSKQNWTEWVNKREISQESLFLGNKPGWLKPVNVS